MMPEKMAEVKLAGEIERAGDILDGKPFVGEQQPRLVEPRPLDVLMNGSLARRMKQRPQSGIADFCDRREFERFPIPRRVGGNRIQHPHDRHRQFRVRRSQDFARYEQFAKQVCDREMHLPFPPCRFSANQSQEFVLRAGSKPQVVQSKLRVFVIADFFVPEFKPRTAETNSHDGQMPAGQGNVSAR